MAVPGTMVHCVPRWKFEFDGRILNPNSLSLDIVINIELIADPKTYDVPSESFHTRGNVILMRRAITNTKQLQPWLSGRRVGTNQSLHKEVGQLVQFSLVLLSELGGM